MTNATAARTPRIDDVIVQARDDPFWLPELVAKLPHGTPVPYHWWLFWHARYARQFDQPPIC